MEKAFSAENFEELLFQPMKLIEEINGAINETDSYKQECHELHLQISKLAQSLRTIVSLIKGGNGRFCESPTKKIIDDVSKTLQKCYTLVKKCRTGGIFGRVMSITSAADFRKAMNALKDTLANVNWLLNVATDDDPAGVHGLVPIASAYPNLSMVWALISKLQGGTPELKEGAASYLASLVSSSEQCGQFILQEGGVPQLLRLFKDGNVESQVMAATALGNLAIDSQRVQWMAKDGAVSTFVQVLERGAMKVQAKIAWAMARMISSHPQIKVDFGSANAIKHLVTLMLESMEDLFPAVPPLRAASLDAIVEASLPAKKQETSTHNDGSSSSTPHASNQNKSFLGSHSDADNASQDRPVHKVAHSRSSIDSPYSKPVMRDMYHRERDKQPVEVRNDLKVQVTKALWLLAEDNVHNSRKIALTKAVLGFAKLVEKEQGEVQRHALTAILKLAEAAEVDADLRKSAFKPSSAAAKAVVDQLCRILNSQEEDPDLQVCCATALGCLARTFLAKSNDIIKCLVMKLSFSDRAHFPLVAETLNALLKFIDKENYLHLAHSQTIVEVPGLPYVVQLAVLDVEKTVQLPAIYLLSQLALNVGQNLGDAFQESAALSILKFVAASFARIRRYAQPHVEETIFRAIHHLEFCQTQEDVPNK